jgi:GT2 family glycosyltransferase
MGLPSLSIVIPTYNGLEHLRRLLPTVRRHAPPGTQVIVVDDGSTDGTTSWLRAEQPWVELVGLSRNGGFCVAVNAGLARARGEIVELLNNDTEVTAGWAEAALRCFADPGVGSVAPLVVFMDRPDLIESAGQEYHLCGWGKNRGYGRPVSGEFLMSRDVLGPSGSSGFYRRQALAVAGFLLPEYEAYYEDVDLSLRLRWAGFRCVYAPGSRVLHRESASYRGRRDRVVWLLARNEELVYWINLQGRELLLGLLPHLVFVVIRALRRTLHGQGLVYLGAKRDALRQWRWVLERRRLLARMARQAAAPVDLQILKSPIILRDGWEWITARKAA